MIRLTNGAWAHRQQGSTSFLTQKKIANFSCAPDGVRTSGHGIRIWSLDLESDNALPIEPLCHPRAYVQHIIQVHEDNATAGPVAAKL